MYFAADMKVFPLSDMTLFFWKPHLLNSSEFLETVYESGCTQIWNKVEVNSSDHTARVQTNPGLSVECTILDIQWPCKFHSSVNE